MPKGNETYGFFSLEPFSSLSDTIPTAIGSTVIVFNRITSARSVLFESRRQAW